MPPVRRTTLTALVVAVTACGGDTTPLPPLAESAGYQRLVLDTAENVMMRRLAMWVDTTTVTRGDSDRVRTTTRLQTDMKLGGMSLVMDVATEYDCAGRRMRMREVRDVEATVKGQPLPDSIAQRMTKEQGVVMTDSTWRPADAALVATLCRRGGAAGR